MTDARVDRLAAPLIVALFRAAIERGVNPVTQLSLEGLDEILLGEGTEAQLDFVSDIVAATVEVLDAIVTVWGRSNTRALTRIDPHRNQRLLAGRRKLRNRFWERIEAGEARWVGTQMPTNAHAQDARMSLA